MGNTASVLQNKNLEGRCIFEFIQIFFFPTGCSVEKMTSVRGYYESGGGGLEGGVSVKIQTCIKV